MDRRAVFFLAAAAASAGLVPLTAGHLRWVPEALSVTYLVLALASYLDWRTQHRG